ncbi:ankyrin repeat domain-containing protein [Bacillus sp. Bva_UNVM-123]|uniref:ankyrin repeat domain-containing protein n=1 Tax=Bacillus sp. Bva_UNVM-123 TaxID=2829798 RepID=UPI00391F8892
MRKWLGIIIGVILFLQGCTTNESGKTNKQEKGRDIVSEGLDVQLQQAVEHGEANKIKELLKEGANINGQDIEGRTPVMIATYNNDAEMVKVLIEAGADVNIRDHMKNNPFLYAGAEGYLEILKLTIAAGADPTITNRYGGIAIIPASERGHIEVIKELLTNTDIDINHVNNLGWTALIEAIILNNGNETQQQVVQLLVDYGADVNIPDHDHVTPFQHAQAKGFKEIEEILLKAGAK